MRQITLDYVKALASEGKYNLVPLCREIFSDIRTPIEVMRILMSLSQHSFILESAGDNENWGRYTFLGFEPEMSITCLDGKVKISSPSSSSEFDTQNPADLIRKILAEHKSPVLDDMPAFTGGLVGYFAYDYLKYSEPYVNLDAQDIDGFNDFDLMLFDKVIAFDNFRQKILLIVNVKLNSEFRKLFTEEEYCANVRKAKEHIFNGDIFQIVLSNRLEADFNGSLFNAYRVLRTKNPSPYMFYFSGTEMEAAGASP